MIAAEGVINVRVAHRRPVQPDRRRRRFGLGGRRPVAGRRRGAVAAACPSTAVQALPSCRLINGYGPTECTTFSATHPIAASVDGLVPIPIGRPLEDLRAYVLDAALEPCGVGIAGEALHRGRGAGARLSEPAWADGRAVRGLPVRRRRGADVPRPATGRAGARTGSWSSWAEPTTR
ncbi:AMP-binding protein [Caulobacter segnis]